MAAGVSPMTRPSVPGRDTGGWLGESCQPSWCSGEDAVPHPASLPRSGNFGFLSKTAEACDSLSHLCSHILKGYFQHPTFIHTLNRRGPSLSRW